ncbi:uncharacterized protein LOC124455132 [Xenia sp. Carnegie-2017]|uniref:uncharacterized protein LOC124455132 n=1 Tax=Xenia sp. Carnegie-2017 TaxID=2897299 RepID=UPI001F03BBA0|nr:uncharacterized protein LOC124455132 [Xenia sp. Carnegie-2017]
MITEESKQPCQHSQSHLSPTGHYTGLLLQFDFASNVSRQQSFVVHDYNANKRTIMHNSFVFVHRYPHLLLDGYGWILCCSCDANRKQFVEALPNNIQLDPQKKVCKIDVTEMKLLKQAKQHFYTCQIYHIPVAYTY